MNTIKEILATMNKLYYKEYFTPKENYSCFDDMRELIRKELHYDDFYLGNLYKIPELVDNIRVNHLMNDVDGNKDYFDEFRQLLFQMLEDKIKFEEKEDQ